MTVRGAKAVPALGIAVALGLVLLSAWQLTRLFALSSSPWQRARSATLSLELMRLQREQLEIPVRHPGDPRELELAAEGARERAEATAAELARLTRAPLETGRVPGDLELLLAEWIEHSGLRTIRFERTREAAGPSALARAPAGRGPGAPAPPSRVRGEAQLRLDLSGSFHGLTAFAERLKASEYPLRPLRFRVQPDEVVATPGLLRIDLTLAVPPAERDGGAGEEQVGTRLAGPASPRAAEEAEE